MPKKFSTFSFFGIKKINRNFAPRRYAMETTNERLRLTVIVTFYNAEMTIAECAHSLMQQTMSRGIEYLFVDDGSSDRSVELLEATAEFYPHRKEQVRIVRLSSNKGTAYARQRGLEEANGEFVTYCDADDWIEAEAYATMLRVAEASHADMVCTPYIVERGKGKRSTVSFPSLDFPQLNDMPLDTLHGSLWNKIVRRSVINDHNIRFFEGINCWEDLGLMFRIVIATRRIVIYNQAYYHYRRSDSHTLSTNSMARVLNDHLRMAEAVESWFGTQPESLMQRFMPFILFLKFTAKIKLLRGHNRDLQRWRATYPESNDHIMQYRNIPRFYRWLFYLAHHLPYWLVNGALRATNAFQRRR